MPIFWPAYEMPHAATTRI